MLPCSRPWAVRASIRLIRNTIGIEIDLLHVDQDIGLHHTQRWQIELPIRQNLAGRPLLARVRARANGRSQIRQVQARAGQAPGQNGNRSSDIVKKRTLELARTHGRIVENNVPLLPAPHHLADGTKFRGRWQRHTKWISQGGQ